MTNSVPRRRRHVAAGLLLLSAAGPLTGCGQQSGVAAMPRPPSASGSSGPGAGLSTESGSHDGAPHYNDNSAGRRPGAMSPADASRARKEAARIEPVLKNLWQQRRWDPASVRSAMLALGYQEKRSGTEAGEPAVTLEVRAMDSRFEGDHYVTPAGAQVGLTVDNDACVTAFVQKTNYDVQVNGLYPESGCFEPPFAH